MSSFKAKITYFTHLQNDRMALCMAAVFDIALAFCGILLVLLAM